MLTAADQTDLHLADDAPPDQLSVLIVEDNPTFAESLTSMLRRAGFTVECVADGFQAVKRAAERRFNIIIMDLMLPYLNGTAAARQIRFEQPGVPIVGMSAYSSSDTVDIFLDAGGTLFLDKREIGASFPEQLKSLIS